MKAKAGKKNLPLRKRRITEEKAKQRTGRLPGENDLLPRLWNGTGLDRRAAFGAIEASLAEQLGADVVGAGGTKSGLEFLTGAVNTPHGKAEHRGKKRGDDPSVHGVGKSFVVVQRGVIMVFIFSQAVTGVEHIGEPAGLDERGGLVPAKLRGVIGDFIGADIRGGFVIRPNVGVDDQTDAAMV